MEDSTFEGQMSGMDFSQNENLQISALPGPTTIPEIPQKIDFKSLPEHVLKTDVIETLIGQNEDLMARLTVALRRSALLDEKVSDAKTESTRYKNKYHNVMDQMLVLREQCRVLSERLRGEENRSEKDTRTLQDLKEQIQIVEIRYAELYTLFQDRKQKAETQIDCLQRRLSRFHKYRANIRRAVQQFRNTVRALHTKRQEYESSQHTLKHNLDETTAYITQQAKDHKSQLGELTQSYENQIKTLQQEIQMLEQQNSVLGERSEQIDRLFTEKTKLENELIINNRRLEALEISHNTEISDLQKSLARYKNESAELSVQMHAKLAELSETSQKLTFLEKDHEQTCTQVETLQLLWREQQTQVEKLTNQKDSLQKLNKELSVSINEYRREIRELKEGREADQFRFSENQKMNEEKIKMLSSELAKTTQL